VILQVNGQAIEHSNQLPPLVAGLEPGSTATLQLWHDRALVETKVRVAELKEPSSHGRDSESSEAWAPAGLSVRPLTSHERENIDTQGSLVISNVSRAAARAGLERGDIVLAVNGKAVKSVKELQRAIQGAGRMAALLIQRGDAQIFVPIQIEDSSG
jgi:serine protease Do